MATKQKTLRFDELSRFSQAANVLYPDHAPPEIQKQMRDITARHGSKAPTGRKLLSDAERGSTSPLGGQAKGPRKK